MAEVSTNRQYLQGQWRVDAKAYDTLAAELKQFEEWASPQLAHYVEQQERIAQLVAALRDVKDATGITAKASLANQAWINRRCTAALKSPSLTRESPHCPSCSCGLASETPPRHGTCPFCGGMGGAHLITCEYSPAFKAETPEKYGPEMMRLTYDPGVRAMWHEDCDKSRSGIVHDEVYEDTRTLVRCLHCGRTGYFPVGATSVCVAVESRQEVETPAECSGDPNSCPENEGTGRPCSREHNASQAKIKGDAT